MLVGFLSDEQAARYRRYHADPSPEQLARFFYLGPLDLPFVAQRRRPPNQLGYAVQLCTLRFLGPFLPDPTQVPAIVVQMLAEQLHLAATGLEGYRKRPSTWYEQQASILAQLDYRPFEGREVFRLTRWLYAQAPPETPRHLFKLVSQPLFESVKAHAHVSG